MLSLSSLWNKKRKRGERLYRLAGIVLAIAFLFFVTQTVHLFLGDYGQEGPTPKEVTSYILLDLVLLLLLVLIIVRRVITYWIQRHFDHGHRLQRRIIMIFSLVASLPTILVAIFSTFFFNFGIQAWFNDRVEQVFNESVKVAEAYRSEHHEVLRGDIIGMVHDLEHATQTMNGNVKRMEELVNQEMMVRALSEAVLFERSHVLQGQESGYGTLIRSLPDEVFSKADEGLVALIMFDKDEVMRALMKLNGLKDTYLLVGREVDPQVLQHVEHTHGAAAEYYALSHDMDKLQMRFLYSFVVFSLVLLSIVIAIGTRFARSFARPIASLVEATELVQAGNWNVSVEEGPEHDEIGILQRGFKTMIATLSDQQRALIKVNQQLDARRHFNEMIIAGISASVIALDKQGHVILMNDPALRFLGVKTEDVIGKPFTQLVPEFALMLQAAARHPENPVQEEITLTRNQSKRILVARVAFEPDEHTQTGLVITFDDITELVLAERTAIWSDVARRIAHEIKNPLTPIYLATERIKRKYQKEVSDPAGLEQYTDTILRNVQEVNRMVEEFANFARMPEARLAKENIVKIIGDVIFSRQGNNAAIHYSFHPDPQEIMVLCDAGQMTRVFTNLFKNAEESIETAGGDGHINVFVAIQEEYCTITICDDGQGFPPELLSRITEPYVTTRSRGSGLGLAIVKKIVEDHNGSIMFVNNDGGRDTMPHGAKVVMRLKWMRG